MKFKCWKCGKVFQEHAICGSAGVHATCCRLCGYSGVAIFEAGAIIREPIDTHKFIREPSVLAEMTPFEKRLLGYMKEIVDRMPRQEVVVTGSAMSVEEIAEAVNKRLKEFEERNSMKSDPIDKPDTDIQAPPNITMEHP